MQCTFFICTKNNLPCGSMILGEVIKLVRIRLGMTQATVCLNANITQGYYSAIENGSMPSLDILLKISEVFDLPLCLLIFMATEKRDIPKRTRVLYNKLKPTLDNIIEQAIPANDNQK